ncbi:DUF2235 domain-containing protein [Pseudomonas aeruginosa]|nr:DUF2235 domain-containing protein [Pseudomonas aeruginosa]QYE80025.1 DUF2235 domain-containing protein [Pseudomonas aeruginosa]
MPNFGFHTAPTHPVAGRLIYDSKKLSENILKQQSGERVFSRAQEQKRLSEGDVVGGAPCCKTIHITLGFDGTNNNDKADGSSVSPSCSNVAKLIHASIGGGDDMNRRGFFKYYCPGVGTVFPDIKEFTPSGMGLIGAEGGENRINWGLVQLVDALSYTLLISRINLMRFRA